MSADTILEIAEVRDEHRAEFDALAGEIDFLADRLMKIGLQTDQALPS